MPQTVHRLLATIALERANEPAIAERDRVVTYSMLMDRAGGVLATLRDRKIAPADRVAILLERGAESAAALLGIHAAGGVAIFVNDRLRPRQLAHVIRDADPRFIITRPDLLVSLGFPPQSPTQLVDMGAIPPTGPFDASGGSGTDLAQIFYTSGSTGLAKGVVFVHSAICAGIESVLEYLGVRSTDRVASLLPFSTVYGFNQLVSTLARGATLVLERSPLATDIVATLRRDAVSIVATVPALWSQLVRVPDFRNPLPTLRQIQNAGAHLPVEIVRQLRHLQPQAQLFLQYGMTETWRSTALLPADIDHRPGSMGKAVPGAEVLVIDDRGALCEGAEVGQLVHAGPTVASGYWRRPAESAAVFGAHPFRHGEHAVFSGDMVRRDAEGFLYYVGRRDRIINTLGYRVGPDEIVDVLHDSGFVTEAVVLGEDDPERGQRIVAHIVLRPDSTVEQLSRHCRGGLAPYMQPARYVEHDALPRLASGKYDHDALMAFRS